MSAELVQLVERAIHCGQSGQDDESERLWRRIIEIEPRHTQALSRLGTNALARGDTALAREMLEAARLTAPTDLVILMALAETHRLGGDPDGEFQALQWALAVDPSFLPALLAKGAWCDKRGNSADGKAAYKLALGFAGPPSAWPTQLRPELEGARTFVRRHTKLMHEQLQEVLANRSIGGGRAQRWQEAVSVIAGSSRPFVAHPTKFQVPRLPALPFMERSAVPGLDGLEEGVADAREELVAALEEGLFDPAVSLPPGEPVGQWDDLNHSVRWCAFRLWHDGVIIEKNVERCPKTVALLEAVERFDLPGIGPDVWFATLAPHTVVPAHHGKTNARNIVHIPVVARGPCSLRVGFENREWREGKALIFDDTIEHELRNDTDATCGALVFDVWNPLLDDEDRNIARAVALAAQQFDCDDRPPGCR